MCTALGFPAHSCRWPCPATSSVFALWRTLPSASLCFNSHQPSRPECQTGDVGTLLLANPVGQNGLDFSRLLSEAAKVFGLRGRRLKLYLDQDLTQGKRNMWWISTMPQRLRVYNLLSWEHQLRAAIKEDVKHLYFLLPFFLCSVNCLWLTSVSSSLKLALFLDLQFKCSGLLVRQK